MPKRDEPERPGQPRQPNRQDPMNPQNPQQEQVPNDRGRLERDGPPEPARKT